jgi:predicted peptidase
VPVVPGDTATALATLARKLGKLPIWMFHGEVDGAVPVKFSRDAAAALKAASANVQYTEYLGMNHDVWDATYGSDAFIQWLFAQKRH